VLPSVILEELQLLKKFAVKLFVSDVIFSAVMCVAISHSRRTSIIEEIRTKTIRL
jgi:cell division protein FtsL